MKIIENLSERDATWKTALDVTRGKIDLLNPVKRLFRSGWEESLSIPQFIKILSYGNLSPVTLVYAAYPETASAYGGSEAITEAIERLGIRFSAVALAINQTNRYLLKPPLSSKWETLLREMMTRIEIGTFLGKQVPDIGPAGGALMGFATMVANVALFCKDAPEYLAFEEECTSALGSKREIAKRYFGCEPYQIAASIIQTLGFGIEVAFGSALAIGHLELDHFELDPKAHRWRAATLWLEELRAGDKAPAEPHVSGYFPALAPSRNGALAPLHIELCQTIKTIREKGSKAAWHLPRASYEATGDFLRG